MPPDGGPVDETPPRLLNDASTPNEQIRFRPEVIQLVFDEWIALKNPAQEVVVSPPTQRKPQVLARGKIVEIRFDENEPWKDSTTYSIQFGKAITDRNEGNVSEGVQFVFSTGDVLDSLSVGGVVIDARSRKPVDDVLVLLHRSDRDSAITLDLPDYFARTDKEGRYRINYMRGGEYRVFALRDRDNNFRYTQPAERLGWLPSPIQVPDTTDVLPVLELPPAVRTLRVVAVDSSSTPGVVHYAFNSLPVDTLRKPFEDHPLYTAWLQDTVLTLWQGPGCPRGYMLLGRDTLIYPAAGDSLVAMTVAPRVVRTQPHLPGSELALQVLPPVNALDTSLVKVRQDTTSGFVEGYRLSSGGDTLFMRGATPAESSLELIFLPGALRSVQGTTHADTLLVNYRVGEAGDFGNILLTIEALPPDQQVLLELADGTGKTLLGPFRFSGADTWTIPMNGLQPGNYFVFLSLDDNRNGRWDGGDYYRGRFSERRSVHELPNLRANWDLEYTLKPEW
jgi:hypothetical protein